MNVIYDIKVLGEACQHKRARTGIFRVVEQIAHGLVLSGQCGVVFYTGEEASSLLSSIEYLNSIPEFSQVQRLPAETTPLAKWLHGLKPSDTAGLRNSIESRDFGSLPAAFWKATVTATERLFARNWVPKAETDFSQADIFHSPFHPIPEATQSAKRICKFLTVYDLIPPLRPEYFEPGIVQKFESILKSIRADTWLFSISESTKDDLCQYMNIEPWRVFVTPLAAAENTFYPCTDQKKITAVRRKYAIPDGPYFLSLNTLEPRKNVASAVASFCQMAHEPSVEEISLVLVGIKGWNYNSIFDTISDKAMGSRVILTGYVPDEDLAALYSGALAFVYPSFYEGFGLPPLEAMQCGVPVITSNTSSLPEVVGDAGITVTPTDLEGISDAMFKVYTNSSLRTELAAKSLQRASVFSWERTVNQVISAYEFALENRGSR